MQIVFSGATTTGVRVYTTGSSLSQINARFSGVTSLTGGIYSISAYNPSSELLGSEQLVIDKATPKAQKITYFDLDHNGKIDQLTVDFDEPIF